MELQNIIYNKTSEVINGLNGTNSYEIPLFPEMNTFVNELEIYLSITIESIVFQLTEEQYGPFSQPRMVINVDSLNSSIVNFSNLPNNLYSQLEDIIIIIKSEI